MMKRILQAWLTIFFVVAILAFLVGLRFDKYLGGYPTPTPLRSGGMVVLFVGLPLSVLVTLLYLAIAYIHSYVRGR